MQPEELEPLVDLLRRQIPSLLGVYLFGSAADERMHPASDIDIAVLGEGPQDPAALWEIEQTLARQAGKDVDLVDLRRASTVLRMQVIRHGRRLFCGNPPQCEAFEDFVYSNFARLNEERAGILKDAVGRKRAHG